MPSYASKYTVYSSYKYTLIKRGLGGGHGTHFSPFSQLNMFNSSLMNHVYVSLSREV